MNIHSIIERQHQDESWQAVFASDVSKCSYELQLLVNQFNKQGSDWSTILAGTGGYFPGQEKYLGSIITPDTNLSKYSVSRLNHPKFEDLCVYTYYDLMVAESDPELSVNQTISRTLKEQADLLTSIVKHEDELSSVLTLEHLKNPAQISSHQEMKNRKTGESLLPIDEVTLRVAVGIFMF